jgi:arginyl-tRNA--protein-N-Asp/Glu arginylyltransferase
MYNSGYVFTRLGKGVMQQTRSVRINLNRFELISENRRILNKVATMRLGVAKLPLTDYNMSIAKQAKDFYEIKFGKGIMSAQKVKEMLTDPTKSNWNELIKFSADGSNIGYAICYENDSILHYSYPFYDLDKAPKDMGLGMMNRAIQFAKETGKKYIYLGSLQRPTDTYKIQFTGLEWFDGAKWQSDIETVKKLLLNR